MEGLKGCVYLDCLFKCWIWLGSTSTLEFSVTASVSVWTDQIVCIISACCSTKCKIKIRMMVMQTGDLLLLLLWPTLCVDYLTKKRHQWDVPIIVLTRTERAVKYVFTGCCIKIKIVKSGRICMRQKFFRGTTGQIWVCQCRNHCIVFGSFNFCFCFLF